MSIGFSSVPQDDRSIADAVYDALHDQIVRGDYRPNERLVEREIGREQNVSRTPVREALQRLTVEGLVTKGRNGLQVREFTFAEIREVYEVRSALESYAARLAAKSATREDIAGIEQIIADQYARLGEQDLDTEAFVAMNNQFHDAVVAAARNERLARLVKINRTYYFNVHLAAFYSREEAVGALNEHVEILDTIAKGDGDASDRLVRAHIESALEIIRHSR